MRAALPLFVAAVWACLAAGTPAFAVPTKGSGDEGNEELEQTLGIKEVLQLPWASSVLQLQSRQQGHLQDRVDRQERRLNTLASVLHGDRQNQDDRVKLMERRLDTLALVLAGDRQNQDDRVELLDRRLDTLVSVLAGDRQNQDDRENLLNGAVSKINSRIAMIRSNKGTDLQSGCPKGWLSRGNKCYYIGFNKLSWSQAQATCESLGGHLVVIDDLEENDFVVMISVLRAHLNYLDSHPQPKDSVLGEWTGSGDDYQVDSVFDTDDSADFIWIGLKDMTGDGHRRWINGRPLTFSNWATGQPNIQGSQNCVEIPIFAPNDNRPEIWNPAPGKWNFANCSLSRTFVCEKQIFKNDVDRGMAVGGHVGETGSSDTESAHEIKPTTTPVTGTPTTTPVTGTPTTTPVTGTPTTTPVTQCPMPWEQEGNRNSCYYIGKTSKTWIQAQITCMSLGGNLVVIDDLDENDFVVNKYRDVYLYENTPRAKADWQGSGDYEESAFTDEDYSADLIWIGLNDVIEGGHWHWINGRPLTYSNWETGQPDIQARGFNCVEIPIFAADGPVIWRAYGRSPSTGKWNATSCSLYRTFVCEKRIFKNDAESGMAVRGPLCLTIQSRRHVL